VASTSGDAVKSKTDDQIRRSTLTARWRFYQIDAHFGHGGRELGPCNDRDLDAGYVGLEQSQYVER
jgi:hypothetical protein